MFVNHTKILGMDELPKLVRPLREVEFKHRGDNLVFKTDTWYEWGIVNDKIHDKVFIDVSCFSTNNVSYAWPHNILEMFRNTFEQLFVAKEEDRDIKIKEILNNG